MLAPGEMFPASRSLDDDVQGTPMEGVEHLGQYVFEMTQAKLKAMGDQDVVIEDAMVDGDGNGDSDGGERLGDEDEVMVGAGDMDDDPLHENPLP